jgi:hypothetical protein
LPRDPAVAGQRIAETIRDRMVTKCGDQYYFAMPIGSMAFPVDDISAKYYPQEVDDQERAYGIEAHGMAHVVTTAFQLVKKNGDWYVRTGGADGDVKIDSFRPPRPACPANTAAAPNRNQIAFVIGRRQMTLDWREVEPEGQPCVDTTGSPGDVRQRARAQNCSTVLVDNNQQMIFFLNW